MVTGAIYKGFVFDGIDSKQYGVYITGQGVFDAPVRDVEMIEIPGRNGSYALDKGRFNNIEVTFPAGMFGNTDGEFMQGICDLRNALASRKGYCRLTDEYNPNEYRMAVYKSGLEVSPAQLKAGQFDITFDCKPQRFLTSGETEQTVTSGATITNPTLFESHPLLLVDGYGQFDINGEPITIQQGALMGNTTLFNGGSIYGQRVYNIPLDNTLYLSGDIITIAPNTNVEALVEILPQYEVQSVVVSTTTSNTEGAVYSYGDKKYGLEVIYNATSQFTAGTTAEGDTHEAIFTITTTYNGNQYTSTVHANLKMFYFAGTSERVVVRLTLPTEGEQIFQSDIAGHFGVAPISVNSTKSALGQLYIDLDIGECYRIENGQYISINTATILPADLPTFNPGANTITYDNTFTSFKVTPRWWKV